MENKYVVKMAISKGIMDDFIALPRKIYKNCPYYVPDLDISIRHTFDQKRNPGLHDANIMPFVAYDEQLNPVGRIVGIVNHKANKTWNCSNVRFGMIEFIDDEDVSGLLLSAVKEWGRCVLWASGYKQKVIKLEGPLGITDFDKEGMLLESYEETGSIVTIYNHSYYPLHLIRHGFKKEVDWVQAKMPVPSTVPTRYTRMAKLVSDKYGLKVKTLTNRDVFKRGYGQKIFSLLNQAYKPLFGYSELSKEQCQSFIKQYFLLLDYRIVPVVEDADGNVVAVAITIGGMSKALQKTKGKLLPTGWMHILKSLKIKNEGKAELLLIAVDPQFHGHGINALLFNYLIPIYNKLGFQWVETGPMLETNQKVLTQWKEDLQPTIYKRRRCFYKEF